MIRWPWVSRRAYELLEFSVDELRQERNDAREEAARAKDQLIDRMGFSPVSLPVRSEIAEANNEIEKYIDAHQFEDVGSGMLSEEVLALADDLAAPKDKSV